MPWSQTRLWKLYPQELLIADDVVSKASSDATTKLSEDIIFTLGEEPFLDDIKHWVLWKVTQMVQPAWISELQHCDGLSEVAYEVKVIVEWLIRMRMHPGSVVYLQTSRGTTPGNLSRECPTSGKPMVVTR